MVDMSKQAEAAVRSWMEAQSAVWDRWLDATRRLQEVRSADDWEREADRLLDQWEETASAAFKVPVEQTARLVDMLREEDRVPRQAVRWAEEVHRIVSEWSEAQRPLWDAWFTTARQFGPAQRTGNWADVMETWRTAAESAARSQAEWASRLLQRSADVRSSAGEEGGTKEPARRASARKTAEKGSSTRRSGSSRSSRSKPTS